MEKSKLRNLIIGILCSIFGLACIIVSYILKANYNLLEIYLYILSIIGLVLIFGGCYFLFSLKNKDHGHTISVKQMTMIAIQSAISIILYYTIKFPIIGVFPSWLDIQISEVPALITSFAYGPLAGSLVILARFFIKLPSTSTAGVGEVADLILSLILVVTSGLIYRKNKTLKGALSGTIIGIIIATIAACFVNYFILIPSYMYFYHMDLEGLVKMSGLSFVNTSNFMLMYIFVGVLPFNLLRYILVGLFTFLLYKRIHALIKKLTN